MVRISGQRGVPVTTLNGQFVVGYDRRRLEEVLSKAQRPRLGMAIADAASMVRKGRTSVSEGAYIGIVTPGGLAERAGLQAGDVIVSVANVPIRGARDLERVVPRIPPGRDVSVSYVRGAESRTTTFRL